MLLKLTQKAISYIKDIEEIGLFSTMVSPKVFESVGTMPAYLTLLPLIGVWNTLLAIINGYHLTKSSNKNLEKWLGFTVAVVCAILSSVSLYGTTIATVFNLSFAAGPWIFLSSVLFATVSQVFMLGFNLYRASKSPKDSNQRLQYLQEAVSSGYNVALLAMVSGAVVFVLLTPAAPIVGSIFAAITVAMIVMNTFWRMAPNDWKQSAKKWAHLNTIEPDLSNSSDKPTPSSDLGDKPYYQRLFSHIDYSDEVRRLDTHQSKIYLHGLIQIKIKILSSTAAQANDKNAQKLQTLRLLVTALDGEPLADKKQILKEHPLAFQSLLINKGEVEQLFDAVLVYKSRLLECSLDNSVVKDTANGYSI